MARVDKGSVLRVGSKPLRERATRCGTYPATCHFVASRVGDHRVGGSLRGSLLAAATLVTADYLATALAFAIMISMNAPTITVRAIIPSFKYHNAPRAIEFLCEAFGFTKHVVYAGADGTIDHAQLKLGPHFIMLGSANKDETWPSKTPRDLGGTTGGTYVVLERDEDVDAHCERARSAGAKIITEPASPDYGGRNYGAQDLEGYLWSFGSYRPESN